jgi:hypothetical protein
MILKFKEKSGKTWTYDPEKDIHSDGVSEWPLLLVDDNFKYFIPVDDECTFRINYYNNDGFPKDNPKEFLRFLKYRLRTYGIEISINRKDITFKIGKKEDLAYFLFIFCDKIVKV